MKMLGLLTLFLVATCKLLSGNFTVVEEGCDLKIITPSLATRKTVKIRLENGLEAYLISDPEVHEAGAALAVHTGSWDDPQDAPGLAHFVEHMLFMGTEKYPDEKEYHRYLDEHGGHQNAFTTNDRTVFMFSVNPTAFLDVLDRFSHFFISPLFNASSIQKERHAVDQEFAKNVPIDAWRILHVKKELANPDHPLKRFSIGNCQTLDHLTRDDVKAWYDSHYSANLMHLVVISPLPIEQLQESVATCFSPIINRNFAVKNYNAALFGNDLRSKMVVIAPKQQVQKLELSWEMPVAVIQDKAIAIPRILSYVLGHEGDKTLFATLKKEGLAEGVRTGLDKMGFDQGLFTISIDLTTKGVGDVDRVIEICFEAINAYKKSGIPSYLFDEIEKISKLSYAYQQREETFDYVTELAYAMVDEPLESFPKLSTTPTKYDGKKIKEILSSFTPEKALYTLVAAPSATKVKMIAQEKWLQVPYALIPIASEKLENWQKAGCGRAILLPEPNNFIPSKLKAPPAQKGEEKMLPEVIELCDVPYGKAYFSKDDRFFVPKISWIINIKTPFIGDENPGSKVLADLFIRAFEDKIKPLAYAADLGGLTYQLDPISNGLKLTLNGYNEKAPEFLMTIVKEMKAVELSPQEFSFCKEELERDYHNRLTKTPITEANDLMLSFLYKDYASLALKSEEIKKLKVDRFMAFVEEVFKECYVEATFFGNQTKEESLTLFEKIQNTLGYKPYPPRNHYKVALASLPETHAPSYIAKRSKLPGGALMLMIDEDAFSFERKAALDIFSKGLEEPFFTELRTKQQTAYLVKNWSQEIERHLYSFYVIQSSSHDPRDLLSRFELFFESTIDHLASEVIPEERFVSIQSSIIEQVSHLSENTDAMGKLLHTLAFDYDGSFNWLDKRIHALKTLTYKDFQDYAKEFVGKGNRKRLAVCISGDLKEEGVIAYKRHTNAKKIRKEIAYKRREPSDKETKTVLD